jgi:Tfp pilus assembly protein PilP
MKLATGILILGMGLGAAAAQNPSILDNTKAKLTAVQQQQTANTNAALAASQGQSVTPPPSTAKPASAKQASTTQAQASQAQPTKPQAAGVAPAAASNAASKTAAPKTNTKQKTTTVSVNQPKPKEPAVAVEDKKNPVDPKKDDHKISMAGGRRDPFLSPVVNHSMGGSGCSTGKRCLAVDQIALTGIVKSDAGMIAVVVNAMNKAYFLRENDPVFNGYVVKITGDSIIFKETMQDKLGKAFTREVIKKISTPAV